jgi:hypothetical protein
MTYPPYTRPGLSASVGGAAFLQFFSPFCPLSTQKTKKNYCVLNINKPINLSNIPEIIGRDFSDDLILLSAFFSKFCILRTTISGII